MALRAALPWIPELSSLYKLRTAKGWYPHATDYHPQRDAEKASQKPTIRLPKNHNWLT
jgi:hypothetical protein